MSRVLPIMFNTDMVRAILDGRKTVTRRLIKPQPTGSWQDNIELMSRAPYQPGDTMYVRETWCLRYGGEKYFYKADKNTPREEKRLIDYDYASWKPSIHMPKEAARIWLKVKDVRVERLKDAKYFDFIHEGLPYKQYEWEIRENFQLLWNSTIKKADIDRYGWDANPFVWVIDFELCKKPDNF